MKRRTKRRLSLITEKFSHLPAVKREKFIAMMTEKYEKTVRNVSEKAVADEIIATLVEAHKKSAKKEKAEVETV